MVRYFWVLFCTIASVMMYASSDGQRTSPETVQLLSEIAQRSQELNDLLEENLRELTQDIEKELEEYKDCPLKRYKTHDSVHKMIEKHTLLINEKYRNYFLHLPPKEIP